MSTTLATHPSLPIERPRSEAARAQNPLATVLVGDLERFPLEHRVSNGMMVVGGALSLLGTVLNLTFHNASAQATAVATLTYAALYVWSRHFEAFLGPALVATAGFTVAYYPVLWVYNCGLDGSIHAIGLVSLMASSTIFSGWPRRGLYSLFAVVTAALFAAEYHGWITVAAYPSREERFTDVFFTTSIAGMALVGLVLVLRLNQRREHEKAVAYGALLEEANRELERALADRERLARTDALTRLPNRRHLEEVLAARVVEAQRYRRPLSLVFLDVDHFKRINDDHGHATGDAVLAALGQLIPTLLRQSDLPGRWGGEELVVLLPETDHEGALVTAERLRETIARHAFPQGIRVTISAGATTLRRGDTADTLVDRADHAAYEAKRAGRNRVVAA